ncbi:MULTISPECIES: hypothetical protein [Pseudomonas]|jgi:hypothetical protein|uniref:Uncharacterized protein n=1 Tax=Serpens gallinarum TaxID=2763075 RepID=A0ABR8TQJ4_9PSED|nr:MULTISPECIES: hypothetical protein [Pseudomonas]MBD7978033.1 hypothetical protein [Serpens gallinarum]MBF0674791.1 hypothetical protein [Pseudomonas sp.]
MLCTSTDAERRAVNALLDWLKARRLVTGAMEMAEAEQMLDEAARQVILTGARKLPKEHLQELEL